MGIEFDEVSRVQVHEAIDALLAHRGSSKRSSARLFGEEPALGYVATQARVRAYDVGSLQESRAAAAGCGV